MQMSSVNIPIVASGGLYIATAAIHAFMGGPEINAPIQASDLHPFIRAISAVIWHALTALFVIFGVALLWTARDGSRALIVTILAVTLAFVALFLGIGIVLLGTVGAMLQWVLFGAIAATLIWGLIRAPAPAFA
ncbi:hypothetical protein Jann_2655 [Jannaschia sp. CCS1]|nr:hypothetical protein Jann_2655 [Jannaschia sp. CCS1]